VLVVLANSHDQIAPAIAANWGSDAAVVTPRDLSRSGWQWRLPPSSAHIAVIGGRQVPVAGIEGVLTRASAVYPEDLEHVATEDRPYVSAEMTAFLLAWLTGLACPVLNRPQPDCLCGPAWRRERWVRLAGILEIPALPMRRHAGAVPAETFVPEAGLFEMIVVGDRCFPESPSCLAAHARRLSQLSGAALLRLWFTGSEPHSRFVGASTLPDLSSPECSRAVLDLFRGASAC
jgi:hypothetical protein